MCIMHQLVSNKYSSKSFSMATEWMKKKLVTIECASNEKR
jgi:hypothetical protein